MPDRLPRCRASGKIVYATAAAAWRGLRETAKGRKSEGGCYRCPGCHSWHITASRQER